MHSDSAWERPQTVLKDSRYPSQTPMGSDQTQNALKSTKERGPGNQKRYTTPNERADARAREWEEVEKAKKEEKGCCCCM